MFFDGQRALGRLSWWYECLVDSINTNVPAELDSTAWMHRYEDEYFARLRSAATEYLPQLQTTCFWPIRTTASLLVRAFCFPVVLAWAILWLLAHFIALNVETLLKLALFGIALPFVFLTIFLCDIHFTSAEEDSRGSPTQ